ncbi:zinc finger protein 37 homolog isoform X1 [Anopheles gambiae]|uniref:zinc finger protein 37 homolog isoform X1 n=1 Tax=Anopheles gambiae TaxID=7165 RepID=UPI001AAC5423|nr:zinc finger protein 37 homolog isoform X1 [Anopheles gambiae]
MAIVPQELSSICRFCLCLEEKQLLLIAKTICSSLTIEDVRRCTGIPILPDDVLRCAICFECLGSLKKSTDFRYACIRNDATFRRLCVGPSSVGKKEPVKLGHNPMVHPDADPLELKFNMLIDEVVETKLYDEDTSVQIIANQDASGTVSCEEVAEVEEYNAPYSANYIDLGEPFSDDTDTDESKRKGKPRRRKADSYGTRSEATKLPSQAPTIMESESDPSLKPKAPKHKKVLCYVCGIWITNIDGHIASHNKQANFACPHCPVKMINKCNLMRHVKQVHEKRIIMYCELCGKGFTHKNNYVSHMRSQHNIGRTYDCSVCFVKFRHQGALRNHFRSVHLNETFPCATCGMVFRTPERLKRHQPVHSTEQPYVCRQCPKRFKYRYARTIHEITHTGVIFRCRHCDKSYRYKAQLNVHLRKTHPDSESDSTAPLERATTEETEQTTDTQA